MNTNELSTILIISFLMILAINWIYFFNWIGLIGKLVYLINPKIINKDIEENRKITKHKEYMKHMKKWKLIFLVIPFIFSCLLLILELLIQHFILSYFLTFAAVIMLYCFLGKYEQKEKTKVLQHITDKTGDGSLS